MRIIVTGATGFIGGRLLPALVEAGHDVAAVVRPGRASALSADVSTIDYDGDAASLTRSFKDFEPEACIHLATVFAGQVQDANIDELLEANIAFGARVANAFAQTDGKTFVYTSTFSQHRNGATYDPTIFYAATKQAFADLLRYYSGAGVFKVVDLQLFDNYGAGDTRPKIWNFLINAVESGEPLQTTAGEQMLSPVHVTDVVRAIAHTLVVADAQEAPYGEYRANGAQALRLREAVELFGKANDFEVPIEWGARAYGGNEMFELWDYGEPLPGWSPEISLEDGFRELWNERSSASK